jgi:hypothetical protein
LTAILADKTVVDVGELPKLCHFNALRRSMDTISKFIKNICNFRTLESVRQSAVSDQFCPILNFSPDLPNNSKRVNTCLENRKQVRSILTILLYPFFLLATFVACGNEGTSPKSVASLGPTSTVRGSIASQSGNQADMQGWVVALVDRDTEVTRIAEVDAAGLYTLKGVSPAAVYTILLLSPTYIVAAVLSHPGLAPNTVRQYFRIASPTLPRLIHKGPVITLQNEVGLQVQKDVGTDINGDGIPDGIANVIGIELNSPEDSGVIRQSQFSLAGPPKSTVDFDKDGLRNISDPDIDGDGLANSFDSDDDGDGLLDIFDLDSDGDVIADSLQTDNDLYFPQGVEWIMAKFEMTPEDAGGFKSSLSFFTKVRSDGVLPTSVGIHGAPHLLAGANVEVISEDKTVIEQAWDRLLSDDGKSEDSAADDFLFAKKILLPAGRVPAFHQVVFFELAFGTGDEQWFMEFPYTFAPVTPKAITSSYEKFSGQIKLSGNPFGDIQDFLWTASVYDTESGLKIYTTEANTGGVRSVVLPTNILEEGKSYTYNVTAQVLDRVPGYVAYTINSKTQELLVK